MLITLNPDNSFASLQKWDDLSPAIADFTGPFVPVLDGDTIEVLHNTHAERVRLNGIDCPEKGRAW